MTRITSRTLLSLASAAVLSITAAACGDDDDSSDATEPAAVTTPATAAAAATTPATDAAPAASAAGGSDSPEGASTVMVADSDLGEILVDGEGMTLYVFMPDNAGPSTCTGGCLAAWPALAGPATAGEGADEAMLGTATRPDDGSEQTTYNGWPLYYFGNDSAPGDVNGQGLNDVWYVVDATGAAVGAG